jgi:hypothetical protein
MPDNTQTTNDSQTQTESLGWRAGLPDDLKENEALKAFKTVGDFAKDDLAVRSKVSELEGKLSNYVPKLPDDASDEDRNLYYDALGRPKQPSEYKLQGEDKNAPEWTNFWKTQFHRRGITAAQADGLSGDFNAQIQKLVEAANAQRQQEITTNEQKLRTELGDKFDTSVELAKRMWTKYGEGEFDKAFENGNSAYRATTIRMLLKFAALTGEDKSPQGGMSRSSAKSSFIGYSKSPAPPKKS